MSSAASARLRRSFAVRPVEQRAPERRRLARFERELHALAHGQLGEQRRGLERAAEADTGAAVRREVRHVLAQQLRPSPSLGT